MDLRAPFFCAFSFAILSIWNNDQRKQRLLLQFLQKYKNAQNIDFLYLHILYLVIK